MSDRFDQLARSLFFTVVGLYPHWGTLCGLHEHDDELPDAGPEVVAERWNEFRRSAEPLLTLPSDELTAQERIDVEVVRHVLEYANFQLVSVERWKKDPDPLSEIGLALCSQLARDYATADERMDQVAGRLDKMPQYLEAFRAQVIEPVPHWTDMAIETAAELPAFLRVIASQAEHLVSPAVRARLNKAVERAVYATDEYCDWLRHDVRPNATAEWVIGPDAFAELCERRALRRTPAELRELGQEILARAREQLAELAAEVKPGGTLQEALAIAYTDRPRTFDGALEEYVHAVQQARAFVRERDLVTLPQDDTLEVAETPLFLRQVFPVAGYLAPGWFEDIQTGTYFVTPPQDGEDLGVLHNAATIYNTTVHEAVPGHHLQALVCNAHAPVLRLLPGLFGSAAESTEGWALYCEHLMAEEGFTTSSQRRLVQMRDHCMRAARMVIDVGLHTGEMSMEEAVQMLQQDADMPLHTAQAEVRAYSRDPGYYLSYVLGTYDLVRLRDDVRNRLGPKFELRWFHDTVLRAGEIPFPFVRQVVETAAEERRGNGLR